MGPGVSSLLLKETLNQLGVKGGGTSFPPPVSRQDQAYTDLAPSMEIRRRPLGHSGNRQAMEQGAAAPAVTGEDDRAGLGLSWRPESPGGAAQAQAQAQQNQG